MVAYWIGAKGGYRLVRRYGSKVRLDSAKLKVGRYIFDRHGSKVVFFGRFVAVLRTYASFLAGTNRMNWRRYFVVNAASGIVWSALFTLYGHASIVWSVAFSPDSQWLVTAGADDTLRVWSVKDWRPRSRSRPCCRLPAIRMPRARPR